MDIIKESNVSLLSVAYSTRSVETVSIQRLPVFLSAAEHLNFTRAAEEQCISQTAVSQQIKLLEQELGYALFVRGKRGVSLTPAGEVFYRQCKQLMIRYNDAAAQGKKIGARQRDGSAHRLRRGLRAVDHRFADPQISPPAPGSGDRVSARQQPEPARRAG